MSYKSPFGRGWHAILSRHSQHRDDTEIPAGVPARRRRASRPADVRHRPCCLRRGGAVVSSPRSRGRSSPAGAGRRGRSAGRRPSHVAPRKQVYAVCATCKRQARRAPFGRRARPPALHRGFASRPGGRPTQAPGPRFLGRGTAGVTRLEPVPVRRAPRGAVVLPPERGPGASRGRGCVSHGRGRRIADAWSASAHFWRSHRHDASRRRPPVDRTERNIVLAPSESRINSYRSIVGQGSGMSQRLRRFLGLALISKMGHETGKRGQRAATGPLQRR